MSREIQQRVLCLVVECSSSLLLGEATENMSYAKGKLVGPNMVTHLNYRPEEAVTACCEKDLGITPVSDCIDLAAKKLYQCRNLPYDILVDVHIVSEFQGTPMDTKRLTNVGWYRLSNLPFSRMFSDDQHWLYKTALGEDRPYVIFDVDESGVISLQTKIDLEKAPAFVQTSV